MVNISAKQKKKKCNLRCIHHANINYFKRLTVARMRPGAPVRQRVAAPSPCLSAPRAARAHGYNELLHRPDWEPASVPTSEQQTHRHRPRATPAPPARSRMPGGKRGLVAPQNTFLENIVRRSSGESVRRTRLVFLWEGGFGLTGWRFGPGLCWNTVCFYVQPEEKQSHDLFFCTDGVYLLFKTARAFVTQYVPVSNDQSWVFTGLFPVGEPRVAFFFF